MEYKSLESIRYIEFDNNKSEEQTAIVFFHGYGANAKDLVSLKDYMQLDQKIHWIFPEGIFDVSLDGKSWFSLDLESFDQMCRENEYEKLALIKPLHLEESISKVNHFLKKLKKDHSKLILGGFSQGSALALNLAFYKKEKPKALVLFSSSLMNKEKLSELSSTCKGLPFIQSHGEQDNILSYEMAKRLYAFLKKLELKGEFISFQGGHEIPLEVLEKTNQFLKHL